MITATSPSKFASSVTAAALMLCLGGVGGAVAEQMPDTENGRFTLSPVADGVIRLDTRTGAVSTCSNNGNGWACYSVPDERAAFDAEIGRLQAENEKLKSELAAREPTVGGKIDEPLPKTDSLKKPEPKRSELSETSAMPETALPVTGITAVPVTTPRVVHRVELVHGTLRDGSPAAELAALLAPRG